LRLTVRNATKDWRSANPGLADSSLAPAATGRSACPREEADYEQPRPKRKKKKRRKARQWRLPSARNLIFGVLFCLLGSIMACGGLTSGKVGATLGGTTLGISLMVGGIFYFRRSA